MKGTNKFVVVGINDFRTAKVLLQSVLAIGYISPEYPFRQLLPLPAQLRVSLYGSFSDIVNSCTIRGCKEQTGPLRHSNGLPENSGSFSFCRFMNLFAVGLTILRSVGLCRNRLVPRSGCHRPSTEVLTT